METRGIALIDLPTFTDCRGSLTAIEKQPFEVKRAFWLYDLRDVRGGHAHKTCQQLIVAVHGVVKVEVGGEKYWLMNPSRGLYVPPGHVVDLYGAGTALVLCSDYYDRNDYIERGTAECVS
jgi:dTDP-4-dehydrorhamnose 3,5-epimerase-like enzyme